ncbi:unnamed protein product [Musa banksii]
MKGKQDDERKDVIPRFQHHCLRQHQQLLLLHKRECLSDEVDSSRSSGEVKKAKADVIEQTAERGLVVVNSGGDGGGGDGATIEVAKRRRGRPLGSKNKPKTPVVITREAEAPAAMRPHVLEIPAGHDVAQSLAHFARRRNLGICVLAGTGSVANVALRQPHFGGAPPPPQAATIGFRGRFEILSISATFLPPAMAAVSPRIGGEISISLAGPQRQVVGGTVAGPLIAAGTVVVVSAAFSNPTFHRLPVEDNVSISVSISGGGQGGEAEEHEPHVHHQHQQQRCHDGTAAESCGMSIYGNRTLVLDLVSINFTLLVLFISPQFKSHVHG